MALDQHDQHVFDRSTLQFHTSVCVVSLLCTMSCLVHSWDPSVQAAGPRPLATTCGYTGLLWTYANGRERTRFLVEQHWHSIHENIVFGVRMLCIQLVITRETSVSVCWNVIVRLNVCAFVGSTCTCGCWLHLRQRWSCSRGASCVVEYTMGRLRDWSL